MLRVVFASYVIIVSFIHSDGSGFWLCNNDTTVEKRKEVVNKNQTISHKGCDLGSVHSPYIHCQVLVHERISTIFTVRITLLVHACVCVCGRGGGGGRGGGFDCSYM